MREMILGPMLRTARLFWPSDRFLWPLARIALAKRANASVRHPVVTADGFRMDLKVSEYPDGAMYFGVYEVNTVRLFRTLLRPGDTAIDVGANIGYMMMHMARCVGAGGRVHGFEPLPDNVARVGQTLTANGFVNTTLHAAAVGAELGKVTIFGFAGHEGHALSSLRPLYQDGQAVEVDLVTLDHVLGRAPVRLIKVDVEGAEVGVLRGATEMIRRNHPHIIVENNDRTLKAFGHSFVDIYRAAMSIYDGYEAIALDAYSTRLIPSVIEAGGVPYGNVWLRPRS